MNTINNTNQNNTNSHHNTILTRSTVKTEAGQQFFSSGIKQGK
jgi:hypothetical protein